MLGAPTSIGLAHVRRGFDSRDEFEDDVGETNDAYNTTGDVVDDHAPEEQAADEDVDYTKGQPNAVRQDTDATRGIHLQMPRPRKEKRKDA